MVEPFSSFAIRGDLHPAVPISNFSPTAATPFNKYSQKTEQKIAAGPEFSQCERRLDQREK
jgi:hypothetical protein